jgi:hypothetical protein
MKADCSAEENALHIYPIREDAEKAVFRRMREMRMLDKEKAMKNSKKRRRM